MTYAEYDALPGLRWSRLSTILDSPALYRHRADNPQPETRALVVGSALHAAVLEPAALLRDFACWSEPRRGKGWTDFKADHAHQQILTAAELEMVSDMAAAVRSHPVAAPWLCGGKAETPLEWHHFDGRRCKARVDFMHPGRRVLLELKTARSTDLQRFGWSSHDYRYPAQLAWYAQGIDAALGWRPEHVIIIAVEKTAPYDVLVLRVPPDVMAHGAAQVQRAMDRLAECEESGLWPGRYTEEQEHPPAPAPTDLDLGDLPEED